MDIVSKLLLFHFERYINTLLELFFSALFLCMWDANAISVLNITRFLKDVQYMGYALCMHFVLDSGIFVTDCGTIR